MSDDLLETFREILSNEVVASEERIFRLANQLREAAEVDISRYRQERSDMAINYLRVLDERNDARNTNELLSAELEENDKVLNILRRQRDDAEQSSLRVQDELSERVAKLEKRVSYLSDNPYRKADQ